MVMVANLVQETCPPPGSGTVALNGVVAQGFAPWSSAFSNGDRVFYCISDGTKTEIGEGVFNNTSVATLIRSTVLWSSLGGTGFINFTATVRCWNAVPAERLGYLDDTLRLPLSTMPRPLQDMVRCNTQYTMAVIGSGGSDVAHFDTIVQHDMTAYGASPYSAFTIPSAGYYDVQYGIRFTASVAATLGYSLYLTRSGSPIITMATGQISSPGSLGLVVGQLRWSGALLAADVVTAKIGGGTATAGQCHLGGGGDQYFALTKLSP